MTFQVSFISLNTGTKYLVMGIAEEVLCQGCANRREAVIHSFLYKHNSFKDFIHPYLTYTHFDFYKQAFHQYHQAEIEQSSVRGEDQSCVPEPHLLTPSASRPRGTRTCCFTNVPPHLLIPPLATQTAKWCLRDLLVNPNYWSHGAAESGSLRSILSRLLTKTQAVSSMSWAILFLAPLSVEGIS